MQQNPKYHYVLLVVMLAVAVVCAWLIPQTKVNSDMTKYLPDHSQMKAGLDIMSSEFDLSQMTVADVKIMFSKLSADSAKHICQQMSQVEHVQSVTFVQTPDTAYTLFSLVVPKTVDQKALGASIAASYGPNNHIVVETSQDGATPPFSVIVIAAVIIMAILFLMSKSWFDPLLYLLSIGIAVVINMGTNALLPSVSITTNYIGSILQIVLSLDYAIVMMNRFRQEWGNERTACQAVSIAMRKAYPSILSSALTTVVGLMVLAFMRLKIGLDMGVVLAKGVVCSLVCTFAVLPSLLIFSYPLLVKTPKPVWNPPTDRLARFATSHKVSLAIAASLLFVAAFWGSQKTPIFFCTNGESQIQKVFPQSNTFVVLYDTSHEQDVFALADSLRLDSRVEAVVSYPTLLKQPYSADSMTSYIHNLVRQMSDYLPDSIAYAYVDLLTPELMRTGYYLHARSADTLHVGFVPLMRFIRNDCMSNPMFADLIDADMRDQMQLLDGMLAFTVEDSNKDKKRPIVVEEEDENVLNTSIAMVTVPSVPQIAMPIAIKKDPVDSLHEEKVVEVENFLLDPAAEVDKSTDSIPFIWFVRQLSFLHNDDDTQYLAAVTDTVTLHRPLSVQMMSDLMGSTLSQTRMVYSYSRGKKEMTPLEYVHLLTDDLFHRKSLGGLVRKDQKAALTKIAQIMDYANRNAVLSSDSIYRLLSGFGLSYLTPNEVQAIAYPKQNIQVVMNNVTRSIYKTTEIEKPVENTLEQPIVTPKPVYKRKVKKVEVDPLEEMLDSTRSYTYMEMAANFEKLGHSIQPSLVNLLYNFYGGNTQYVDTLRYSVEDLLNYLMDSITVDPRFNDIITPENRVAMHGINTQLAGMINAMSNDKHALFVVQTTLPAESPETYDFTERLQNLGDSTVGGAHYYIGESVMFSEMKDGFNHEMTVVTILTILSIFLIIAITFRSLLIPTLLTITVMTAVYVNVVFCGIVSGAMLYLAYLIVQSILMGATIDYGILYTHYYKEKRATLAQLQATQEAYRGSIHTIMTSGLIMVLGAGVMALFVEDVAISSIVGCLAIGAAASICLILFVLPAILVALDRWIIKKKNNN